MIILNLYGSKKKKIVNFSRARRISISVAIDFHDDKKTYCKKFIIPTVYTTDYIVKLIVSLVSNFQFTDRRVHIVQLLFQTHCNASV